jgi:hypothetical protein
MRTKIKVPSIKDDENGYNSLFKLALQVTDNPYQHFDFDFKSCSVLDQNAVAIIGGLASYVDAHNNVRLGLFDNIIHKRCGVMFKVDSMSPLILNRLIENNFLSHFSQEGFEGYPEGGYIGFRQHRGFLDVNSIASHLSNDWLTDEKVSISPELKSAVISRILEIFLNAYGHGILTSNLIDFHVISCGQYVKKEKILKLTVVDFGCGIIKNVQKHLNSSISDIQAMEWALTRGNSTRTDSVKDMPRGLGFDLLCEFVTLNKGEFQVYSNSCCAKVVDNNYFVKKLPIPFNGTAVTIKINCDERHYKFIDDFDETKQFF